MAVDAESSGVQEQDPPGNVRGSGAPSDDQEFWSGTQLVSATAHQLRGPLTVVRGVLETIRRRTDLDPDTRSRLVDQAIAAAERQQALIETLLGEGGRRPEKYGGARHAVRRRFVAENVGLRLAISRLVRESLTPEDQQRVRLRVPERMRVRIDPVALDCILSNLISNAISYSPAASYVEVSAEEGDGEVRVVVADEGPGIDPDDRERIFEPYERSSKVAGVGLGLAIARWAVDASGGRIWVDDEPGGGARFCFTLPAPSHTRSSAGRRSSGRGSRVE